MELNDIMKTIAQAKRAAQGSLTKTVAIHGGLAVEAPGFSALFAQPEILCEKGEGYKVANPGALSRFLEIVPGARVHSLGNGRIEIRASRFRAVLAAAQEQDYQVRIRKTDAHVALQYPQQLVDAINGGALFMAQQLFIHEGRVVAVTQTGAAAYVAKIGQELPFPVAIAQGTVKKIQEIWPSKGPNKGFVSPGSLLLANDDTWVQFRLLEDPDKEYLDAPKSVLQTVKMAETTQSQGEVPATELQRAVAMMAAVADVEDVDTDNAEEQKARAKRVRTTAVFLALSEGCLKVHTLDGEVQMESALSGEFAQVKVNLRFLSDACKVLAKRTIKVVLGQVSGLAIPHITLSTQDLATTIIVAGLRDDA
ncbi:hypothetical protein HAQ00_09320 [Acidithiobacillus caldus ATCC 51756]|jgi:hypothetical protein|uniref:hypothetical protein n=1 Tax=Acidithiobacillus caldus TaxID=33059 RepID=UPI001C067475|nr:hypothetical protein [Acidithiobacillus caldus]MBU2735919.1 hypothetical protein [Acidithiobacillus caldus ATCC 51756]MBU2803159.1 hypothetical protein [Acidithiobacillus caldus]